MVILTTHLMDPRDLSTSETGSRTERSSPVAEVGMVGARMLCRPRHSLIARGVHVPFAHTSDNSSRKAECVRGPMYSIFLTHLLYSTRSNTPEFTGRTCRHEGSAARDILSLSVTSQLDGAVNLVFARFVVNCSNDTRLFMWTMKSGSNIDDDLPRKKRGSRASTGDAHESWNHEMRDTDSTR